MNPSTLLKRLLALLTFSVVEGGGGAVVEEDDDLELDAADAKDEPQADEAGEGAAQDGEPVADAEDADEVVITLGDEPAAAEDDDVSKAPEWVRDLRKQNRQLIREKRELEQRLASSAPAPQAVVVGDEPTLEDPDVDFDTEKFRAKYRDWTQRKLQAEEQVRKTKDAEQAMRNAWQTKLDAYDREKSSLKVRDFEDAEEVVKGTFSVMQQGVILNGADKPAAIVYVLGRNPAKAKELGSITDPVKFAFAVAKLETQLKVTPRKTAPIPDRQVRGSAPVPGGVDSNLERLREEAAKTGDFSKVHQYRQQQRQKKAA